MPAYPSLSPLLKISALDMDKVSKKTASKETLVFVVGQDSKARPIVGWQLKKQSQVSPQAFVKICHSLSFEGKTGQIAVLASLGKIKADRVLLLGIGNESEQEEMNNNEKAGAQLYQFLAKAKIQKTNLVLDDVKKQNIGSDLVSGLIQASYSFDKYKDKDDKKKSKKLPKKVEIYCSFSKNLNAEIKKIEAVASGLFLTRDLVNEPPNILHPGSFAARIQDVFRGTGVKVTIMGEKKLKALGADLLLSVGQASVHESKVVVMEYNGLGAKAKKSKPVAFVGKGVSFDTGGNNLKPFQGLLEMKMDMGGAGVVTGLMQTLVARKAKVHVIGAVGLVENMIAGNATRPSDVVKAMSGKTVEILNTDAEGRLVLADVMWHVQEKYKPSKIIDLATLTGAVIVSLGNEFAGLFSNSDTLAEQLLQAGQKTSEPLWRLPLCKAYSKAMQGDISDLKNLAAPSVGAGSSTAAAFLQEFVKDGVEWAHLDIAGVTFYPGSWAAHNQSKKTASGYGVRLLNQWVADHIE